MLWRLAQRSAGQLCSALRARPHTLPTTRGISTTNTAAAIMSLQVSANLSCMFKEYKELQHRYGAAKRAGFQIVEVSLPYEVSAEHLQKALMEHNLKQELINTDPGRIDCGEMGYACIPGKEKDFMSSIEKSIIYAKALQCKKVHILCGNRQASVSESDHMDTLTANLQMAVKRLSEEDIVALIEPKNNITFPNYFLNDYEKAMTLINKINSPNLCLLMDIFHMQLICGNLTNQIRNLMPYTGHIQVSQAPDRHEPGYPGEVDYEYIIYKIKEAGYTGRIGAEYTPSTSKTEDSLGWIKKYDLQM